MYCIGNGKDHKQYEYDNKVSIACATKINLIVGVVGHELKRIETERKVKEFKAKRMFQSGKPEVQSSKASAPASNKKIAVVNFFLLFL